MWDGTAYETLPLESLTLDSCDTRMIAPYCVAVRFFATTDRLLAGRGEQGDSLTGRSILPGDLLIYDESRTTPEDGVIMLIRHGKEVAARVCVVLADGTVEFHAAAEGYPIFTGACRVYGTLAAVVRATEGREVIG